MNTLELFLANAGGENVEATHQRILAWLLGSRTVVKELFPTLKVESPSTQTEVFGRLFDIQLNEGKEIKALIEIKMWAALSQNQQDRQQKKAEKLGRPLYYFLFGISGLERIDFPDNTLTMDEVASKFKILAEKSELISQDLKAINFEAIDAVVLKRFLISYAERLEGLNNWLLDEAWQKKFAIHPTKSSHFASLFHHLKNKIEMQYPNQFRMPIYRTDSGKNVTIEINHFDAPKKDANRTISMLDKTGRLIFWVKNEHLEIFFNNPTPKKIKISKNNGYQIRELFNHQWKSNTDLETGKKLHAFKSENVKWVSLLRINLFSEKIESLEQLEELATFVKQYYDAFKKVKQLLS